jgi:nickel transport protein
MLVRSRVPILLLALAVPTAAASHETLHEIARSKAIAVKAFEGDGRPLADVAWEVYSPGDPRSPWQRGRTDRNGWLAFVPGAPGKWRVRVIEKTGHGLDTQIDVDPALVPTGAPQLSEGAAGSSAPIERVATRGDEGGWAIAFLLRPVLGVGVIVALFAALFLLYRNRSNR